MTLPLCRREFLKVSAAAGGAFALEFIFPLASRAGDAEAATEVNAWILIHPDERVVIRFARSEMGQGTMTALAQLVAEELDADWTRVSSEFASPNEHFRRSKVWGSMSTGGSMGVRSSQDYVRRAGASAREMLIAAAAGEWQVPASECRAASGIITHLPSGRTMSYGQVAAKAAKLPPPAAVKLRDPKDWKLAGNPLHRLDIPDKVRGLPVFGVDANLPGMLHASIAQCPVFGGKLKSVDAREAEGQRGVKQVVRAPDYVAVVADSWWHADQALKKLQIEWDTAGNETWNSAAVDAMLREGLDDPKAIPVLDQGDVGAALAGAAKVVEAEYSSPYLNHATMEPMTCTAWFRSDGFLDVWTSTQNGEAAMLAAAQASGLPLDRIEVHKMMLGGGFGRRGVQDYVTQGVTIAQALAGTPVKLIWSREEDMQHGFYRPASRVRMKAGLDPHGRLVALHTRISCPSILKVLMPDRLGEDGVDFTAVRTFNNMPYGIPNQRVDYAPRNGPVRVGFWRGPGQQNGYYRECFLDELAHLAGRDPLAYRLEMLKPDDKNRLILEATAKAGGWGDPIPVGMGRGLAVVDGFGSYAACVAEVSVDRHGELKVHRVAVGVDSGYVVNPDTCRAQAESNVAFGLSALLFQENRIKAGRIVESNFHNFRLLKLAEMPAVETVLAPTGGFWGGHGEPAILPLAPAVVNAVFAATGKRIRSLPLKHHDLRRA